MLVWGAVNANPPVRGAKQVEFKLDYSGGYGKYHNDVLEDLRPTCQPYNGPALAWQVNACKAPDGSYWALQAWQRGLLNYGVPSSGPNAAKELRLSHWTGDLPALVDHDRPGQPGARPPVRHATRSAARASTASPRRRAGVPHDSFGRNIYVDTFDSAYGSGWKRENSFLTHGTGGSFCYLFASHGSHPPGDGKKYRATVIGPGVTPDVMW